MAYFFRDDAYRHRPEQKPQGRAYGARPINEGVMPVVTRDATIEQQIGAMQDTIGTEDFIMKKIQAKEPPVSGRGKNPTTAPENNIFGPPRQDTPPAPRIRPGVSDEDLRKIWAEDERKAKAAQAMQQHPTMVEKMLDSKHPVPHPQSPVQSHRKATELPRAPTDKCEVDGFRGIGKFSEPEKARGPRVHTTEFEPPQLIIKPRTTGRRQGNVPADTWSFEAPKEAAKKE